MNREFGNTLCSHLRSNWKPCQLWAVRRLLLDNTKLIRNFVKLIDDWNLSNKASVLWLFFTITIKTEVADRALRHMNWSGKSVEKDFWTQLFLGNRALDCEKIYFFLTRFNNNSFVKEIQTNSDENSVLNPAVSWQRWPWELTPLATSAVQPRFRAKRLIQHKSSSCFFLQSWWVMQRVDVDTDLH